MMSESHVFLSHLQSLTVMDVAVSNGMQNDGCHGEVIIPVVECSIKYLLIHLHNVLPVYL